jgi:hypothetical protein
LDNACWVGDAPPEIRLLLGNTIEHRNFRNGRFDPEDLSCAEGILKEPLLSRIVASCRKFIIIEASAFQNCIRSLSTMPSE